jgi:hypothetical protein
MRKISFLFVLFILSGCVREKLTVYNEYVTREQLASYAMGTPDPLECFPPFGQRLRIHWDIRNIATCNDDSYLNVYVRLRDRKNEQFSIPIDAMRGWYYYEILGERYCETDGILTYLVQLVVNGEVVDEWRNALWSELITFDIKED